MRQKFYLLLIFISSQNMAPTLRQKANCYTPLGLAFLDPINNPVQANQESQK